MIDSHAHLGALDKDIVPYVLERAHLAGLVAIINIATDAGTLQRGKDLLQITSPAIFMAAATTPHDVVREGESFFPLVVDAIEKKQLIAIGETGLDYHYMHSPKEVQIHYLKKYIELAKWANLPLIIHCRDAFDDLFSIAGDDLALLVHCFTGTREEANEVIQRGWHLSLSGIVTFPKSTSLQEIAAHVPLDQLLIETDTPYLAPQAYRGKTNEPAYVVEVAKMVARQKNIPLEEVVRCTCANTKRFFHVP